MTMFPNTINSFRRIIVLIKNNGGLKKIFKKIIIILNRDGLKGIKRVFIAFDVSILNSYKEWIRRYDKPTGESLAYIKKRMVSFSSKPLITILMPIYNSTPEWLMAAIDSVLIQVYPHWEMCIAFDPSADQDISRILREYAAVDSRIKLIVHSGSGHDSTAYNCTLEFCSGEWLALLGNSDLISEHALFWVADAINQNPNIGLIYSDEDKIDNSGKRLNPYFKCDWNVDLFYSHNLVGHLSVYRSDVLHKVNGFRIGFEGASDYDLALRLIELLDPEQVYHIPRILYHERVIENDLERSEGALLAGVNALNDHLKRKKINARAEIFDCGFRVFYETPSLPPMVSIIIPTRNGNELIQKCVQSITQKTTYPNYEILIIDNSSDDAAILKYFDTVQIDHRVRVVRDDRPFNYSALNNAAVKLAKGDIIGLLNNDLEVISPEWLSEMVSIALQPKVGAVGARLWYPDNTLQHGGIILGIGGVAGHSHKNFSYRARGYFGRAIFIQSFSAVTAACLVIRKSIYLQTGGLNETQLPVAFNDVDFCLRVREAGFRNVWTPYAELFHHESATRGYEDNPEKQARFKNEVTFMKQRWGDFLLNDPAYNPNLTLCNEDFGLAWPPRIENLDLKRVVK